MISTMQNLTVTGAATTPGHALTVGEERKMAAHAEDCRSVRVTFVPLVVESLEGWSQEASHTISSIGRLQGQRLGIPPSETTRHLFQRLAHCGFAVCQSDRPQWTAKFDSITFLLCPNYVYHIAVLKKWWNTKKN